MDRRTTALLGIALVVCAALFAPQAALAVNAYGQTFAGQSKCLECHSDQMGRGQVPSYTVTAHGQFVTDVASSPAALVPGPAWWPSPTFGNGLRFSAREIKWMLGAPGVLKEYVTIYRNDAPATMDNGQSTVPTTSGPTDDYLMINGTEWNPVLNMWETPAAASNRTYFSGCGGCHFLGVTRPSKVTTTLASGATMSPTTPTSYQGVGIQCEHCHGTGSAVGITHGTSGVQIVRTKGAMRSEICGQCHVNGSAKEPNYIGKTFSGPNGYTPDRKLEDFYNVSAIGYRKNSRAASEPVIPTNDTKVFPNGANKGMHHSYYNEWAISAHARSFKYNNGDLWTEYADDSCLKCHSGEGFLESIGYGGEPDRKWNDLAYEGSSLASDTLNIECAVCHTVHQTGGDSLGLRMEGDELCSRCHNSELERGEATPGQSIYHSQKEMREGYGLIGVPTPTKRFMGETGCPSCHMPTTYENRVSHSFKAMTPGNAKAWKVQAGGDSCTPCHSSLTRDELQAELDEWAEDLDGLSSAARDAISSAKSRPASMTAEGKDLIGAASTNVSFVEADRSRGAHNYPYAKAGLEKAVFFAKATGASFPRFGATAYNPTLRMSVLYGTLAFGDGSVAAGERVTVQAKLGGTTEWVTVGTATTGDDGDFGYSVGPAGTTAYRAVWSPRAGVTTVSGAATVAVPSTTSAAVSSAKIALGKSVVVSGGVTPNHSGVRVTIQYRKGTGSWRALSGRTLTTASRYACSWRPSARGSYSVRTVFGGDATHTGSVSATKSIRVY